MGRVVMHAVVSVDGGPFTVSCRFVADMGEAIAGATTDADRRLGSIRNRRRARRARRS